MPDQDQQCEVLLTFIMCVLQEDLKKCGQEQHLTVANMARHNCWVFCTSKAPVHSD